MIIKLQSSNSGDTSPEAVYPQILSFCCDMLAAERFEVNSMKSSLSPALSQRNRLVWECFLAQIRPHGARCWTSFECQSTKAQLLTSNPGHMATSSKDSVTTTTLYNVKMTMISVCSTRPAQSLGLSPIKHLWDEIE